MFRKEFNQGKRKKKTKMHDKTTIIFYNRLSKKKILNTRKRNNRWKL